jgi:hypothetical protein
MSSAPLTLDCKARVTALLIIGSIRLFGPPHARSWVLCFNWSTVRRGGNAITHLYDL